MCVSPHAQKKTHTHNKKNLHINVKELAIREAADERVRLSPHAQVHGRRVFDSHLPVRMQFL
jgi:hypothetical protein